MLKSIIIFLICSITLNACQTKHSLPEWPWEDPDTPVVPEKPAEPNENIVEAGWTNVSKEYGDLPEYINIYRSPGTLQDKKAVAYIAVADMAKNGKFEVLGDLGYCDDSNIKNYGADKAMTPSQFYDASKAPVLINGGLFFWAEKSDGESFWISQNLAVRDGEILAVNQTYWVEDWSATPIVTWYPTIGAFYQTESGTCSTTWTYTIDGKTFFYPQPADNSLDKAPLQVPSANFPSSGKNFNDLKIKNAIGGVGVLLNKGEIKNTWKQELMGVAADSDQPRTAIGSTADKRLIFFVCEGREVTEGVKGLTTGDVAEVMKSLGCTEALNLDGGGSSCMLVNGKETIKPSGGEQRAVLTALRMY